MRKLLTALCLVGLLMPTPVRADDGSVSQYCDVGVMADGNWTHPGAAGGAWWLPFGSLVWLEGIGTVIIEDRGSYPYLVDIWEPSCTHAWQFGRQYPRWVVVRWGWGQ